MTHRPLARFHAATEPTHDETLPFLAEIGA